MPNFWTKTAQFFEEAVKGPRTKDLEFQQLIEKTKVIETGVMTLKSILQNFVTYSQSIGKLFKEIADSVDKIYDTSSPFYKFTKEISDRHQLMYKDYEEFYQGTSKLYSKTSEWTVLFTQTREQIKKREEKRKVYEHYEQKLDKLLKNDSKNKSKKEQEMLDRNEDKFQKAAEDYIQSSEQSFRLINEILDRRYDMVNPVLADFIKKEYKFFGKLAATLSELEEIDTIFEGIKNNNDGEISTFYDPLKGTKGRELMKKVSFHKTRGMSKKGKLCQSITMGSEGSDEVPIAQRLRNIHSSFPKADDQIIKQFNSIPDDIGGYTQGVLE